MGHKSGNIGRASSVLGAFSTLASVVALVSACQTSSGPVYRIQIERGDTLARIARKYDTSWQSIVRMNDIDNPRAIAPGQVLRLRPGPNGRVTGTGPSEGYPEEPASARAPSDGLLYGGDAEGDFRWPLEGEINSQYGPRWGRFHHGIDIAGRPGERIRASAEGRVIFVGRKSGYGKTVMLKHGDGSRTLYAHCRTILVSHDEWVETGAPVATVGATGEVTGPHLHFEVRLSDGSTVDPLRRLPEESLVTSL